MGTFTVPVDIGDARGERWQRVAAAVDTGANFSVMPAGLLRRLGHVPAGSRRFRLAGGGEAEFEFLDAPIRLDGQSAYTPIVFGNDDAQPILGAIALERFGLAVDPTARRLVPIDALLL